MVVTERYVNREVPACARDRDVEETTFFLEPFGRTQRHVRRKVAVGGVNDMNRVELETLR
jgi:hypothetical protein